jgi:hypothetical protein
MPLTGNLAALGAAGAARLVALAGRGRVSAAALSRVPASFWRRAGVAAPLVPVFLAVLAATDSLAIALALTLAASAYYRSARPPTMPAGPPLADGAAAAAAAAIEAEVAVAALPRPTPVGRARRAARRGAAAVWRRRPWLAYW